MRLIRAKFTPPAGYDWLDQHENPQFPLVLAEKAVVKAYKRTYEYDYAEKIAAGSKAPNVVFISLESFTPSPAYLSHEFIAQNDKIFTGSLYNSEYLPNLARY